MDDKAKPRGPRGVHVKRLDADGVPLDGRDWTERDWADLWHGITAVKARIAGRHRPNPDAPPAP